MRRLKAAFQFFSEVVEINRSFLQWRRLTSLIQTAEMRRFWLCIQKTSCSLERHFQEVIKWRCGKGYRCCGRGWIGFH
ncbi:hypothetical protein IT41_19660 [Paracoccus halophilus]|uniref:Uncharacterized protein n=1 Tax=Paracoccus halophilus TaxID=376733 RepID=A0A099EUE5_9RHOB|nr:hypothetical protein IT41_19660 [Paracoccus halophilus]